MIKEKPFTQFSNQELLDYTRDHYKGLSSYELRDVSRGLHAALQKNNLIDSAIKNGVMIRKRKKRGYFFRMDEAELRRHIAENHAGSSITEFMKNESAAYKRASHLNIIPSLVQTELLYTSKKKDGFYSEMGNDDFIKYVSSQAKGLFIEVFKKNYGTLYKIARRRKLIDRLIENSIIKRNNTEKGKLEDLSYVLDMAVEVMKKESTDTLPGSDRLTKMGYHSLVNAIRLYHKGFPEFRRKLDEYLGRSNQSKSAESILEEYLAT